MLLSLPITVDLSEEKTLSLNLNTYRNTHHFQLNQAKVIFGDEVAEKVKALPAYERVALTYILYPRTKRRSDVANVCSIVDKFFSDVLVAWGKLPDDDYEHLPEVVYRFGAVDKENPRVDVLIEDLNDPDRFSILTPEKETQEMLQFNLPPSAVQEALTAYVEQLDVLKPGNTYGVAIQPDGSALLTVQKGKATQGTSMPRHPIQPPADSLKNQPEPARRPGEANAVTQPGDVPTNEGQSIEQESPNTGDNPEPRPAVTPGAVEREVTITPDSGVGPASTGGEAPKPIATTVPTTPAPNFVRTVEVPEGAAPQQGPEGQVVVNTADSENPYGQEPGEAEEEVEGSDEPVDRGASEQSEASVEGQADENLPTPSEDNDQPAKEVAKEEEAPAEAPKKKRTFNFGGKGD